MANKPWGEKNILQRDSNSFHIPHFTNKWKTIIKDELLFKPSKIDVHLGCMCVIYKATFKDLFVLFVVSEE